MGMEYRTILGAVSAGTVRCIIETPFEYMKVKRQTLQKYSFKKAFTGFKANMIRANAIMLSFFTMVDSLR